MFLTFDANWYNKRFNLHRIHDIKDLPCIKEIGKLHSPLNLYIVNQCEGLLLCLAEGGLRLLVWNPYLAQTRWIELRNKYKATNWYAIGYDNNSNHKFLGLFHDEYDTNIIAKHEIYDFESSSWRVLNIATPRYFERIWKRGEQLAVLFQRYLAKSELVIWITTKIGPNAVSWTNFFKVDLKPFLGSEHWFEVRCFFIDKEKKVAVVWGKEFARLMRTSLNANQSFYSP
ncbi:hypothetical protein F2Q69_00017184 [Brassica cretica]|uniref:F-box associated beta-propeller type 1 domain-containing protein n=1 Tax=Brassica cretica TaxID=69181 RepID=A0A8S9QS91_BRACR|nr:hypothetical protein F2Q69_00017184 [Brassica cretica]